MTARSWGVMTVVERNAWVATTVLHKQVRWQHNPYHPDGQVTPWIFDDNWLGDVGAFVEMGDGARDAWAYTNSPHGEFEVLLALQRLSPETQTLLDRLIASTKPREAPVRLSYELGDYSWAAYEAATRYGVAF